PEDPAKDPQDPEVLKNLFSIVSDGYEILNIVVPQVMCSVDQEESNQMQDKLEYLETNPLIQAKHCDEMQATECEDENNVCEESSAVKEKEEENEEQQEPVEETPMKHTESEQNDSLTEVENSSSVLTPTKNENNEMDYFEKYTLFDDKVPITLTIPKEIRLDEESVKTMKSPAEEREKRLSFSQSSDNILEEYDMLDNDLDEAFYGVAEENNTFDSHKTEKNPTSSVSDNKTGMEKDITDNPQLKASGTPLFDTEETVLIRSYLVPETIKMINPELLEEPPALAFLYKDLYEHATGEHKKDNEPSDEDSISSDVSFRSMSDTDDGTGVYFEKYILKDEVPSIAVKPKEEEEPFQEKTLESDLECEEVPSEERLHKDHGKHPSKAEPEKVLDISSSVHDKSALGMREELVTKQQDQLSVEAINKSEQVKDENIYLHQEEECAAQYQFPVQAEKDSFNITKVLKTESLNHETCEYIVGEEALIVQQHLNIDPTEDSQPVQAEPKDDEEQCLDSDGDIAQALDYEIVTQEDLIQEELPSEYTADDIAVFEDRESLEHPGDGYEFVDELERDPVIEVEEQGFEIMEREELAEIEQKESKKPQLDTYCLVCRCPISAIDKLFGEHEDHEVTTLDAAVIEIKGKLNEKLLRLQERSTKIEELVTEIESIFNAVEEHCGKNEQLLEEQNEEMMKTTLTQYNEMSQSLEEVKKMKLEYLYEQMVSFQQGIDSAREILEKSIKDSEETDEVVFLTSCKATNNSLVSATEKTLSLEMMPSAFSLFEHYAESSVRSGQKMLKQVAVPRTPKLQAQEPNSATSTSVTVYWTVSEEDVIDCFQVYCMEEPQGGKEQSAMVEEYRVTVKESYCILEDLEPDKCYQVWVMAVNYTGCSLPSEKATFKTAPSAPGIKVMECTICWDTAVIRWSTVNPEAAESFTLEYCRQYSLEGEGLRSISGIKSAEQKVNLQPNENYFFYVRAVNTYGSSEQSEAALISTKGTRFHLKGEVDHPDLQVSSDGTVICFSEQQGAQITEIPVVYGELLPARGQHYWETIVDSCEAYRIGVCYPSTLRYSPLGENNTSWCMHCYPTGTRHSYEFLHNDVMASAMVTEYPARVGILLDYSAGRLSFFNAQSGQLLHNFRHRLTDAARPAFVVEKPGVMNLHTGIEIPDFVRHS
uniref:Cardiomyopathy associated 5 n=1 Tax=Latimeria chalumnae TaxID=7897 RepID=H3B3T2_LATCH